VGFEGECDLHGFTGENETLLNRWNSSFLLNLLFDFCDLFISAVQTTSSARRDGIVVATGTTYRHSADGN
jgi:hypothetical protein